MKTSTPDPARFKPTDELADLWLNAINEKTHQPGLTIPGRALYTHALMHIAAGCGDFDWIDYTISIPEEEAWQWRYVIERVHRDLAASIDAVYRLGGWKAADPIVMPILDQAITAWNARAAKSRPRSPRRPERDRARYRG